MIDSHLKPTLLTLFKCHSTHIAPHGAINSQGELNASPKNYKLRYKGFVDAFQAVLREDGPRGFFRGVAPRVLQIGPSCALSWCAYESAKKALQSPLLAR